MKETHQIFDPNMFIPQLSIDYVIFSFHEETLKVLALGPKKTDFWVLPAGFILQEEDLEIAAQRNLKARTGIADLFLRQFYTFGKASRLFPDFRQTIRENVAMPQEIWEWINSRFVTIGYYALCEYSKIHPVLDFFSDKFTWIPIDSIHQLAMDHADIVRKAREVLIQDMLDYQIASHLLPEQFTLPELQKLYESVLDRKIDRGNFRKRILKEDILEKLDIQKTGGPHRSPYLYRFVDEKNQADWQDSVKFGF